MEQKFNYIIYGLSVRSDICIQEAYMAGCESAAVTEKEPDVTIEKGKIPVFLREAAEKGYGTWTNGFENAWFRVPDSGQVYVEKGRKIVVETEENANMDLVCSMLLSAGFALILLQRNEPVIHGSAVVYDGEAVIVSGESGAGKSTITMELLKQDVGFLADDTVRVHLQEGRVVASPAYPQQKICRNMVEEYGLKLEKLRYIDEQRDKFAMMRTDRYVAEATPVKMMVVLKKKEDAKEVFSEKLQGKEYLDTLIDNLYLADTYKYNVGVSMQLMQQMLLMAGGVPFYVIYRPVEGNTIEAVVGEIKKILQLC